MPWTRKQTLGAATPYTVSEHEFDCVLEVGKLKCGVAFVGTNSPSVVQPVIEPTPFAPTACFVQLPPVLEGNHVKRIERVTRPDCLEEGIGLDEASNAHASRPVL